MKQLKLTLHMLKLFYYSRKRWPCRLEDALITANVYSTTGNCASSILNKPLGKTTPPLVWSRKTGTHTVLLFVQRSRQSAQIVSAEKLQHQVDQATVNRVRKKAEEHQKEGDWCPWEKPSMPRETLLGFLRPACPRWGLRLHVHSGSQAKLTATGFDSQLPLVPAPSSSLVLREGREAATASGEMKTTSFPPMGATPDAAGERSGEAIVCPHQGFLQAVIFVNWETFPFWTDNSLSFALGIFWSGRSGVRRRQRGCSFF